MKENSSDTSENREVSIFDSIAFLLILRRCITFVKTPAQVSEV